MKKWILIAAAAVICSCAGDREHILKVYNWSDYMDMSAVEEFEQWYEEQTGEPVHVIYQTFEQSPSEHPSCRKRPCFPG